MDDSYDDDEYVPKKPDMRFCQKTVHLSCRNHKHKPPVASPIGPQEGQQKERYTPEEQAVKEARIKLYVERVEQKLDIWTGQPASFNTAYYWNSLDE